MICISRQLSIPKSELRLVSSRSGGPGGQHVNKVSTRISLFFNVDGSPSLSPGQKALLRERLASRISHKGVLRVSAQKHRSQSANRLEAMERFAELLRRALTKRPVRKETAIPRSARERRLVEKRHRSEAKRRRAERIIGEE